MTNFVLSPAKIRSQSTKTANFVLSKPISQAESTETAPNVLSTGQQKFQKLRESKNEDRKL